MRAGLTREIVKSLQRDVKGAHFCCNEAILSFVILAELSIEAEVAGANNSFKTR